MRTTRFNDDPGVKMRSFPRPALAMLLVLAALVACKDSSDSVTTPSISTGNASVSEPGDVAVPPEGSKGTDFSCPGPGTNQDNWAYRATVSDTDGLVLSQLRFGPRLVAQQIDVPYFRVTDGDGDTYIGFLTTAARAQDTDVKTSLISKACNAEDGAPGVLAIYSASITPRAGAPFSVLIEQSYRFDTALDTACEPTETAQCRRFWPTTTWAIPGTTASIDPRIAVTVVQRFQFDVDHGSLHPGGIAGAADIIRDVPVANLGTQNGHVDDLAADGGNSTPGKLVNGGAIQTLKGGDVVKWENWHQTDRQAVGLPGLTPGLLPPELGGGTAGCSECVHIHWSWFSLAGYDQLLVRVPVRSVFNAIACGVKSANCWADGGAQIPAGSRQSDCLGWTSSSLTETVSWCQRAADHWREPLADNTTPTMYWEASSKAGDQLASGVSIGGADYAVGDSYWAHLPDRSHGGDGSMFIDPARKYRTSDHLPTPEEIGVSKYVGEEIRNNVAAVQPQWPGYASDGTQGLPAGWVLPVSVTPGYDVDQGPFYLRIKSLDVRLLNPDNLWDATHGGAPWVELFDDTLGSNGVVQPKAERNPVQIYDHVNGPMTAALVFDRAPSADQLSFQLDAAPNGIADYEPSTGDWELPTTAPSTPMPSPSCDPDTPAPAIDDAAQYAIHLDLDGYYRPYDRSEPTPVCGAQTMVVAYANSENATSSPQKIDVRSYDPTTQQWKVLQTLDPHDPQNGPSSQPYVPSDSSCKNDCIQTSHVTDGDIDFLVQGGNATLANGITVVSEKDGVWRMVPFLDKPPSTGSTNYVPAATISGNEIHVDLNDCKPDCANGGHTTVVYIYDPDRRGFEGTLAAGRGATGSNGDLGLTVPIANQSCTGQYITLIGSSTDPSQYQTEVQSFLTAHPGSSYLVTDQSCAALVSSVNGNRVYAAYLGPFATMAQACSAAVSGSYVKMLKDVNPDAALIAC